MYAAIAVLALLGFALGYLLGVAANKFKVESNPIVDEVTAMLPGSNCGQCGQLGCSAAAEAMIEGRIPVTCCPPGGKSLAEELGRKLGVSVDLSGMDGPPKLAVVREETCIGCVKCLRACPTDAIVGAPKQIHVVMQNACTGCGACVDVCPTWSIELTPEPETLRTWRWPKPLPVAA